MYNDHRARHKEIAEHLRAEIAGGKLRAGDAIPSVENLVAQFQCSPGTVRRALQTLLHDGLLSGQRGIGTFVKEAPRAKRFGVIVPSILDSEHAHMVSALSTEGHRRGYEMLLYTIEQGRPFEESQAYEISCIEAMAAMRVDGIIKEPTTIEREMEYRALMHRMGVRYVILNDFYTRHLEDTHVLVDERHSAVAALEHLAGLGHRHVAYYTGPSDPHRESESAMDDAASRLDVRIERIFIPQTSTTLDTFRTEFVERGPDAPTALISRFHSYAAKHYNVLQQLGVAVPEQMSVMALGAAPDYGADGLRFTSFLSPYKEMAQCALDLLLGQPAYGSAVEVRFRAALCVGDTTAPPRATDAKEALAAVAAQG